MKSAQSTSKYDYNDDEEDDDEESQICWSDVIFLPFNKVFKAFVLISVIAKSTLGPVRSIYSIAHCSEIMNRYFYLSIVKYYYWYLCDLIYLCDTFLHIVHRQVTDKAMRREFLPKSAFLLLIDVISLIPFYTLTTYDLCPPVQLWPNILAFSEFLVIYRVEEYFSLLTTHSIMKLVIGFTLLVMICVNCLGCFLVLLTVNGLCKNCRDGNYDWRKYVIHKLNETDEGFTTYVYGTSFVSGFVVNSIFDETKPSTILEYFLVSIFMIIGYIVDIFVVMPKIFAECLLGLRRICSFHPTVKKIVDETKRRNPSKSAYINVSKFYAIMWKKRRGITNIPEIISELPRYLRLDIRQDLVWPVFYHSPTLRKTSTPFKRWLCEYICLDYKLPGEKFFAGPHCHTNLYYLRSGIVELLSVDDGVTPLLSFSGGTIFGDVSFMVPPLKRNLVVRCVTYCEVFILSRHDLLRAMQKYPVDRKNIIASVKDRMKHARTLYTCKQHVRGLDRAEDEGIAWIKRRWWEISEAVASWKNKSKNEAGKCDLPPEEAVYHCAKYIGQLVLCSDIQLHKKTLFANTDFPWILTPNSAFIRIWERIVMFTVFLALLTYPPYISQKNVKNSFKIVRCWVDFVYIADICISLSTSTKKDNVSNNFTTVMFTRCKNVRFVLDVFATVWIEVLAILAEKPELYYIFQFNRLLKIYILFSSDFVNEWSLNRALILNVCYKVLLTNFCYIYIGAYVMHVASRFFPDITVAYFFGEKYCNKGNQTVVCDLEDEFLGVAIAYAYELIFFEFLPLKMVDIYFTCVVSYLGFLFAMITRERFISYLYLKYRESTNYQSFVSNLKNYYRTHKIHHDLMKRLDRYLVCQWKYYRGADIMNPNMLKNEPFDIYWKVHGEVAERIIGESQAFTGADPMLVRELAYAAKYLIMPKNATLFLFGVQCRNVTWIVQGHIKCEYHNENGELLKTLYNPGQMVSVSAVLLRRPSLRTYASCTECELIYINIQDFFKIIKRYPNEWSHFQNCIEEFSPIFEEIFETYVKKHRDYQKKLRERIFHAKMSVAPKSRKPLVENEDWTPLSAFSFESWLDPDSNWMFYWMMFRALVVIISIASASLQGGSGAPIRRSLMITNGICDAIAWIDIILKFFMSYYNEKGILVYDLRMCVKHYLTRGFLFDLIGVVPWYEVFRVILTENISDTQGMLMNTFSKFAHLYIVIAFFNHIADQPSVNSIYILILKWQIVVLLMILGASHYLMNHCIDFSFDDSGNLLSMKRRRECWMPAYMELDEHPTIDQLHTLFAQSLNLAQSALMRMNLGKFHIDRYNHGVGVVLVILGIVFWYATCHSLTLLLLAARSNTLYQHGVSQLQKFLTAERVDQKLINDAVAHFGYWWIRNKGINIHRVMTERIGVVFRQDLTYYLFKKTFTALDSLLKGGEQLERQLSVAGLQKYLRPGEEVMREMDLLPYVYVVHRGRVIISQDGEKLAELTKGAIFGQLTGTEVRPVRVSAVADGYADILQMSIEQFQETITDQIRVNISKNRQSKNDYMEVKKQIKENPYNSIEYILRGRKAIKLPWMKKAVEARSGTWYSKWLFITWLIEPFISAVFVLQLSFFPEDLRRDIYWGLLALDIIHLAHIIAEFYTVELAVVNDALTKRLLAHRLFLQWGFYVDVISLILPIVTLVNGKWPYQLGRLLRLRLFFDFNHHFCSSFKSKLTPILMKVIIVILLIHGIVCGWIYVACRRDPNDPFPVPVLDLPPSQNASIDRHEWVDPRYRVGGCSRMTMNFQINGSDTTRISFLVPRQWQHDYLVAFIYIVLLQTHTVLDVVVALTLKDIYYKVFVYYFILLLDMWLVSLAISAIYTKFRELYLYDYNVSNLTIYLHHSGLSSILLKTIKEYTSQLWQRQRGNWLPELAHQAPQCLREDLLGALYMHHLTIPSLFRNLPRYFTRQLVSRFRRVVIFPDKCVVQEGDIVPCMYFIHEGEIEKWYTDASGEKKFMSLLSTNAYFGIIPGLYPNIPFQFSYYTRTVVDMVYLRLHFWQDLLDAYPNVKHELYKRAEVLKKELLRSKKT